MRFCVNCEKAMARETSSGAVVFSCGSCQARVAGSKEDSLVASATLGASQTLAMYANLVRSAAADRTNQIVLKACTGCGRDYMYQIRVGDAEVIIYKCKCGKEITGADLAASAASAF